MQAIYRRGNNAPLEPGSSTPSPLCPTENNNNNAKPKPDKFVIIYWEHKENRT